jgi:hypothetical protein
MKTGISYHSSLSLFGFYIFTTMLKNPTARESPFKAYETEYQKLGNIWQDCLLPVQPLEANINSKKAEYTLSSLIHLFDQYMTQVWTDSQNMLQSSKPLDSQRTSLPPHDESFSLNILGLQLMKQSLRTRKEFLYIVNELNNSSDIHHKSSDVTEYDDSSTQEEEEIETKYQQDAVLSSSNNNSSYLSPGCNRPFRLTSSPSSPAIGSAWSTIKEENTCAHNFKPASNYLLYYAPNAEARHSNLCHLCKQHIALKKSLSADNLNGLINSDSDDDEDYLEHADCGVTLLSSDCSDVIDEIDEETRLMTSKLLIQDDDVSSAGEDYYIEKLQKYNLVDNDRYEGSSKVELGSLESNVSSSLLASPSSYFSVDESKEGVKAFDNDMQHCVPIHSRQNSSSTFLPQSIYSSDNNSCYITNANSITVSAESVSQKVDGATKKQRKLIRSMFLNRNKLEEEENKSSLTTTATPKSTKLHSITRTLSNNKINLCSIFSSRK